MVYLMESENEAERLLMKSNAETTREQLILTGLKEGMTAVDAGGGAGFVTKIMSEIVGKKGKVILLDASNDRLDAAKKYCSGLKNIEFVHTHLELIDMEDNAADFVWCRFVFEYLQNPSVVFKEFVRIADSGSKIVVGDLDYNCMNHYPLKPHLEEQLNKIVKELGRIKMWDAYAGRKIYAYYHESGLSGTKVHLIPHHLIYGDSNVKDLKNWEMKFDKIIDLTKKGVLKFDFDIEAFKKEFYTFFDNPARFSYSPLILVEGVKE